MGSSAGNRVISSGHSDCRLHDTFLAEFDGLRNQLPSQAFYIVMNFERPLCARTEDAMKRKVTWADLPPVQAGVSAALRRAYAAPADDRSREFEEMVRNLR